jgi:hypothetical protein
MAKKPENTPFKPTPRYVKATQQAYAPRSLKPTLPLNYYDALRSSAQEQIRTQQRQTKAQAHAKKYKGSEEHPFVQTLRGKKEHPFVQSLRSQPVAGGVPMKTTSSAYRVGQAMAKRAQNTPGGPIVIGQNTPDPNERKPGIYMNGQRVNMPAPKPGGGVRLAEGGGAGPVQLEYGTGIYQNGQEAQSTQRAPGIYANPGATPDQPTSASTTPNPQPSVNPAPTPKSRPAPVTASPAQQNTAAPNPAITAAPSTTGTRRPPPRTAMMPSATVNPMMRRSAAYELGQQMAKQATDRRARRVFTKLAKVLGKKAGLSAKEIDGMEKEAFAFLPLLLGLAASGIGAYGVHRYGEPRGWWDSPAIKAMKDRMKAIQMAKAQGVDPVQMGLIAPKEKDETDNKPYWSSWGGGAKMPAGLPKGYLDQEKRLQNLSRTLGLGLRHARAYSNLSRMPVF